MLYPFCQNQNSSNCKGRCWHQASPPRSQSEKTGQRCPLPSQWMLPMSSKADREVQVSTTRKGERASTSFIKLWALSHLTIYLTFPKQRIECFRNKSNPTINCNGCERSDHLQKLTVITHRKEQSLMIIATMSNEQIIYGQTLHICTQLSPKDTIHQHRQYEFLYLLAGIVLQIRNVIAHSTMEAVWLVRRRASYNITLHRVCGVFTADNSGGHSRFWNTGFHKDM